MKTFNNTFFFLFLKTVFFLKICNAAENRKNKVKKKKSDINKLKNLSWMLSIALVRTKQQTRISAEVVNIILIFDYFFQN